MRINSSNRCRIWLPLPREAALWGDKLHTFCGELLYEYDDLLGDLVNDLDEAGKQSILVNGHLEALKRLRAGSFQDIGNFRVDLYLDEPRGFYQAPTLTSGAWLTHEDDTISIEFAENFVLEIVRKFQLPPMALEFARICSPPEPLGFSGYAAVVSTTGIQRMDTQTWVKQALAQSQPNALRRATNAVRGEIRRLLRR